MRTNFKSSRTSGLVLNKLRLFWDRITLSRFTAIYFTVALLHFAVQVVFQIQAFLINAQAATLLSDIVQKGNATQPGFLVAGQNQVRMCTSVPNTVDASSCMVMWAGNSSDSKAVSSTGGQHAASSASGTVGPTSPSIFLSSSASSSATTMPSRSSSAASSSISPIATRSAVSSTHASSSTKAVSSSTAAPSSSFGDLQEETRHSQSATSEPSSGYVSSSSSPRVVSTHTADVTVQATATSPEVSSGQVENADNRKRYTRRSVTIVAVEDNNQTEVVVDGVPDLGEVTLDYTCLVVLNWPIGILDETKREDLVFIMFQFWLLAMSLVALLNESVPHIIASLLTHILATGWAGFQIFNTAQFRSQFTDMTTNGACGVDLLPNYWRDRSNAEIPSLVLNAVVLVASAFLTWRLMKCFGWQTFKRVGASRTINRVYNAVLILSITIQLALFFIAVSGAVWIDQVYNGAIGRLTTDAPLFKGVTIVVEVLLIPWLTIGWISVRREASIPMFIFMVLSVMYLAGWASMFIAPTFRWTFVQWRFFSLIATASVLLTFVTVVLGIICRINFGKGLARYLNAQQPIEDTAEDIDEKVDLEKAEFPSNDLPLPTYSVAFGPGSQLLTTYGTPRQAPLVSDTASFNPPDTGFNYPGIDPNIPIIPRPEPVHPSLSRGDSRSSEQGGPSSKSDTQPNSKRWMIE